MCIFDRSASRKYVRISKPGTSKVPLLGRMMRLGLEASGLYYF